MNKNDDVEISVAANGFVVTPALRDRGMATMYSDRMVFQSMAELVGWMQGHFSHRSGALNADAPRAEE